MLMTKYGFVYDFQTFKFVIQFLFGIWLNLLTLSLLPMLSWSHEVGNYDLWMELSKNEDDL